jgi:hypothetical protein
VAVAIASYSGTIPDVSYVTEKIGTLKYERGPEGRPWDYFGNRWTALRALLNVASPRPLFMVVSPVVTRITA